MNWQKRIILFSLLGSLGILPQTSCNNAAEKYEPSKTDSAVQITEPADTAAMVTDAHPVADSVVKSVDTIVVKTVTAAPPDSAMVDTMTSTGSGEPNPSPPPPPPGQGETKASIAYSYKPKMKKGNKENIQMRVQLNKPVENVIAGLQHDLDEQKAQLTGETDSSIIKSLVISGDKYFIVNIRYDTSVFFIERIFGEEKQELQFNKPSKWIWEVTAKKEAITSKVYIMVYSQDAEGHTHESDASVLPIEIAVGTAYGQVKPDPKPGFWDRYGWLLITLLLVGLAVTATLLWIKKRRGKKLDSRIFFSYAWETNLETVVDRMYDELKKSGYNVVRDKVNLGYKGLISNFMKDIGKGNIIIVALSDKYFRSRFCMFELFEIYRNCGMEKETFCKKVFPIREEDIDLSDPAVVAKYVDYWNEEEAKLEATIKDKSEDTTAEQFNQYELVRRISAELGNLLSFLSDINALNIDLLARDDFAQLKTSLNEAIKNLEEQ